MLGYSRLPFSTQGMIFLKYQIDQKDCTLVISEDAKRDFRKLNTATEITSSQGTGFQRWNPLTMPSQPNPSATQPINSQVTGSADRITSKRQFWSLAPFPGYPVLSLMSHRLRWALQRASNPEREKERRKQLRITNVLKPQRAYKN